MPCQVKRHAMGIMAFAFFIFVSVLFVSVTLGTALHEGKEKKDEISLLGTRTDAMMDNHLQSPRSIHDDPPQQNNMGGGGAYYEGGDGQTTAPTPIPTSAIGITASPLSELQSEIPVAASPIESPIFVPVGGGAPIDTPSLEAPTTTTIGTPAAPIAAPVLSPSVPSNFVPTSDVNTDSPVVGERPIAELPPTTTQEPPPTAGSLPTQVPVALPIATPVFVPVDAPIGAPVFEAPTILGTTSPITAPVFNPTAPFVPSDGAVGEPPTNNFEPLAPSSPLAAPSVSDNTDPPETPVAATVPTLSPPTGIPPTQASPINGNTEIPVASLPIATPVFIPAGVPIGPPIGAPASDVPVEAIPVAVPVFSPAAPFSPSDGAVAEPPANNFEPLAPSPVAVPSVSDDTDPPVVGEIPVAATEPTPTPPTGTPPTLASPNDESPVALPVGTPVLVPVRTPVGAPASEAPAETLPIAAPAFSPVVASSVPSIGGAGEPPDSFEVSSAPSSVDDEIDAPVAGETPVAEIAPAPSTTEEPPVTTPEPPATEEPPVTTPGPPTTEEPPVTTPEPPATEEPPVATSEPPATEEPPVTTPEPPATEEPPVATSEPPATEEPPVTTPEPPTTEEPPVTTPEPPATEEPPVATSEPPATEEPLVTTPEPLTTEEPPVTTPAQSTPIATPNSNSELPVASPVLSPVGAGDTPVEPPILGTPIFVPAGDPALETPVQTTPVAPSSLEAPFIPSVGVTGEPSNYIESSEPSFMPSVDEESGPPVVGETPVAASSEPTPAPATATPSLGSKTPTSEDIVIWAQIGQNITWNNAAADDATSLSMSGDGRTVAIGQFDNGFGSQFGGKVDVYSRNENGLWSPVGQMIKSDLSDGLFGFSVSLNEDGTVLAIGEAYDGIETTGRVFVYELNVDTWVRRGQNLDGGGTDQFAGGRVVLSDDGNVLLYDIQITTRQPGPTKFVRVFRYNGSAWDKVGQDVFGQVGNLGTTFSIDLSGNGEVLAIAAVLPGFGYAETYRLDGNSWKLDGEIAPGAITGESIGVTVALNGDGGILAVAFRTFQSSNLVRVYSFDSDWNQLGGDIDSKGSSFSTEMAIALSRDGRTVAIGPQDETDFASVHVLDSADEQWLQAGQNIGADSTTTRAQLQWIDIAGSGQRVVVFGLGGENAKVYDATTAAARKRRKKRAVIEQVLT